MIKNRYKKGNTIIDIVIAILFISVVLLFCYSLATSAINKRQQTRLQSEATNIAENIMGRFLSKGVYEIDSEPNIDDSTLSKISNISNDSTLSLSEKNSEILKLGGRLPVNTDIDAPFLAKGDAYQNQYSYQVIVDSYISSTGKDGLGNDTYSKHAGLKKIVVNVYYPTKVAKFSKLSTTTNNRNEVSLEEEYRLVTLTTYKSAKEYNFE